MNTCAILLILAVQIYADGIEGPTGKACFHLHLLDDAEKSYHVDKTQLKPKKQKQNLVESCESAKFVPPFSYCFNLRFTTSDDLEMAQEGIVINSVTLETGVLSCCCCFCFFTATVLQTCF